MFVDGGNSAFITPQTRLGIQYSTGPIRIEENGSRIDKYLSCSNCCSACDSDCWPEPLDGFVPFISRMRLPAGIAEPVDKAELPANELAPPKVELVALLSGGAPLPNVTAEPPAKREPPLCPAFNPFQLAPPPAAPLSR